MARSNKHKTCLGCLEKSKNVSSIVDSRGVTLWFCVVCMIAYRKSKRPTPPPLSIHGVRFCVHCGIALELIDGSEGCGIVGCACGNLVNFWRMPKDPGVRGRLYYKLRQLLYWIQVHWEQNVQTIVPYLCGFVSGICATILWNRWQANSIIQ
jgi:hypothetical protein